MFDYFSVLMGIYRFEGVFVRLRVVVARYGGVFLCDSGVFWNDMWVVFDILFFLLGLFFGNSLGAVS